MQDFITRVSIDYGYALEHIEELGECFVKLFKNIPEKYCAEKLMTRFTFCTLKLKAETPGECSAAIEAAWNAGCGDGRRVRLI
ncbi:MAG: hypothetical protein IKX92_00575, partial [Clostridia bacterium]|nr:hypothetical protein [Clostridia bacterium]